MVKQGLVLAGLAMLAATANAKDFQPWSLELYGLAGPDADIEQASELSQQQFGGSLSYALPLGRGQVIGAQFGFDWHQFDFSGLNATNAAFAGLDQRDRYEVGVFYLMPLSRTWSVMVSPQLQWAYADGSDADDGFGYSVAALANYRSSDTLSLGFGAAYVNGVVEVQTVPFFTFDWQFAPQWRLANPFDAGFNGRAGVELYYQHSERWEFGVGGAYRSDEFAFEHGDIEQEQPLSFVRASYLWQSGMQFSFVAGYRLEGDLTLHTDAGEQDFQIDGHPLLAFMANFDF